MYFCFRKTILAVVWTGDRQNWIQGDGLDASAVILAEAELEKLERSGQT